MDHGRVNASMTLQAQGITGAYAVYYNETEHDLWRAQSRREKASLGRVARFW